MVVQKWDGWSETRWRIIWLHVIVAGGVGGYEAGWFLTAFLRDLDFFFYAVGSKRQKMIFC